jgi:SNF2 family DNA or RNA helicase
MQFLKEPWKHQENAVNMAKGLDDIMLSHDVGTGKTFSAVNIMRWKYAINHEMLPTLIIAPIVTLANWRQTILENSKLSKASVHILQGSGLKKAQMVRDLSFGYSKPNVFITNLESLINEDLFYNLLRFKPELLILDESHQCKNYKAKRAKQVVKLADQARYKVLLTGTPILNSVSDIFMQYRILDGGQTFGKSFFVFRARYMYDANAGWVRDDKYFPDWRPRPEMYDELHELVFKKCHRAIKSECLDLPPYRVLDVYIELGKEQKKHYKEMKRDFITYINESSETKAVIAQLAITKTLRMQQIVSGFVKTDEGEEIELPDNPRLRELENLLDMITKTDKVIVWALFKHNHKVLARLCEKMNLKYSMINGDMNVKAKDENINAFQNDPDVKVMIANQQAGGTGVNLQAASYSIYYSRSYNLAHDLQSEARNYRGGSEIHEKITRINLIAPDTIDQVISEALARKEDMGKKIIDPDIINKI